MRRIAALGIIAATARAHEGEPLAPHDALTAWSWDPIILMGLAAAAVLYRKGATASHGFRAWERRCYWAGWWSLVLALVSPLHPMGEVLFSAHMLQHEILMLVSAPLLVLGRPLIAYLWGLPESWRSMANWRPMRRCWRFVSTPVNAWWIHAAALWGWHAPQLFQATVTSDAVHAAQHFSFLGSALVFWWALLRGRDAERGYGMAVVYVFTTAIHSSILGALLTFSTRVWYPVYEGTTARWGLTPIEDQQIGGLIMWVPAGMVFVGAGLWLFAKWIQEPARGAETALAIAALLLAGCTPDLRFKNRAMVAHAATGGDPRHGRELIQRYGCGACHTIPGVSAARGMVGPPLAQVAMRSYVAGVLPNTPDAMTRWIKDPPGIDPLTAMPNLGLGDSDARDVTAYLYTLR
jgi:putative membrane protein